MSPHRDGWMVGQFCSSETSPQSSSLSHFHRASIHLEPSAHLNWLAAQAPVQFLSSQLSLQSLSPSQTQVASIHRKLSHWTSPAGHSILWQSTSSVRSPQSSSPSHWNSLVIHWPFLHRSWWVPEQSVGHPTSSDLSAQSASVSQTQSVWIQLPSLRVNSSALQAAGACLLAYVLDFGFTFFLACFLPTLASAQMATATNRTRHTLNIMIAGPPC